MTRKEEIQQAAYDYAVADKMGAWIYAKCAKEGFIAGAEWADAHPLVENVFPEQAKKALIEKACEWLKENASDYIVYSLGPVDYDYQSLVGDFRKAMEE